VFDKLQLHHLKTKDKRKRELCRGPSCFDLQTAMPCNARRHRDTNARNPIAVSLEMAWNSDPHFSNWRIDA
jgi:hypothetical protein